MDRRRSCMLDQQDGQVKRGYAQQVRLGDEEHSGTLCEDALAEGHFPTGVVDRGHNRVMSRLHPSGKIRSRCMRKDVAS